MAGSYPTPPAPRIPYDLDGSMLAVGSADLTKQNSYNATARDANSQFTVVLAQPYDVHMIEASSISGKPDSRRIWLSDDTTNGSDGTWTLRFTTPQDAVDIGGRRGNFTVEFSPALAGIVGVRTQHTTDLVLYGFPSAPPDGLQIWDPDDDQPLETLLDLGNVPRNDTPVTRRFRVKNCSTADDASDITIEDSTPDESTPATAPYIEISTDDGATWGTPSSAPVALDDLDAEEVSPVYLLRYSPDLNADLAAVAARFTLHVDTWT